MNYKHALGQWAENYIEGYVRNELKMRVIGRNIKNKYGEIDIAAIETKEFNNKINNKFNNKIDSELVIIEVRCRTENKVQSAVESVSAKKIRNLIRAGSAYIEDINWRGNWRIDLIALTIQRKTSDGRPFLIEYIPSINEGIFI